MSGKSEPDYQEVVDKWIGTHRGLSLEAQMDTDSPIAVEFGDPTLPWMVFVGGLNQRLGMPVHEFVGISAPLRCNRVFVRDSNRIWYQKGLNGLTDSFMGCAELIRSLLDTANPAAPVGLMGSSAGGFAALGWASAIGAGRTVAFSPQTTIGLSDKLRHDRRWLKFIWRAYVQPASVLDVRDLPSTGGSLAARVIYPGLQAQDRFQAERLRSWPGLVLDRRASDEHSYIRMMRDSGELIELLADECAQLLH